MSINKDREECIRAVPVFLKGEHRARFNEVCEAAAFPEEEIANSAGQSVLIKSLINSKSAVEKPHPELMVIYRTANPRLNVSPVGLKFSVGDDGECSFELMGYVEQAEMDVARRKSQLGNLTRHALQAWGAWTDSGALKLSFLAVLKKMITAVHPDQPEAVVYCNSVLTADGYAVTLSSDNEALVLHTAVGEVSESAHSSIVTCKNLNVDGIVDVLVKIDILKEDPTEYELFLLGQGINLWGLRKGLASLITEDVAWGLMPWIREAVKRGHCAVCGTVAEALRAVDTAINPVVIQTTLGKESEEEDESRTEARIIGYYAALAALSVVCYGQESLAYSMYYYHAGHFQGTMARLNDTSTVRNPPPTPEYDSSKMYRFRALAASALEVLL